MWIFYLVETQFVFSFSEYYSLSFVSFYLSVNTTFKADKLQGLGFLAFSRYAETHMFLVHVQLSEVAIETCYGL